MEKLKEIASYICIRYQHEFGQPIDEMKLHKLLYFVQRESLIQLGTPLFAEKFQAWKYGPVLIQIRQWYRDSVLDTPLADETVEKYKSVFDKIFEHYAPKDSWSLSCLTHSEYSWKKARTSVLEWENSSNEIELEDIRQDAERIKQRRFLLNKLHKTRIGLI
jgi:uncharacterized phage-associated protein